MISLPKEESCSLSWRRRSPGTAILAQLPASNLTRRADCSLRGDRCCPVDRPCSLCRGRLRQGELDREDRTWLGCEFYTFDQVVPSQCSISVNVYRKYGSEI